MELEAGQVFCEGHLANLTLIGLVGMIDPLRPEAKAAVTACRQAGIQVGMVTGDHPTTAMAIAAELELVNDLKQVVSGPELKQAKDETEMRQLTARAQVFARVEPQQKLDRHFYRPAPPRP